MMLTLKVAQVLGCPRCSTMTIVIGRPPLRAHLDAARIARWCSLGRFRAACPLRGAHRKAADR